MKRDIFLCCFSLAALLISCIAADRYIAPAFHQLEPSEAPVLILDAGHGGEDGGALTASGHKESEINLDIVLKLESLLAFLGTDAVLTRNEDVSIHDPGCTTLREKKVSDLKNREALINSTSNAMVISVHQNTFTDSRYKGTQVFFGSGEISLQWGNLTQTLFQQTIDSNNSRNASAVPEHVYLFKHIDCPAILVECGFLSNGEEAALLLTDAYQRKLALVLTGAYFHQLQMIPTPLGGG